MSKNFTFSNEKLVTVAVAIGVSLFLYIALVSSLAITLAVVVFGLGLIMLGERSGKINAIYEATGKQKNIFMLVIGLLVLILPFLAGNGYLIHILVMAGIYAIVVLGLNFQVGSTGMVNFAPAALFGMGAYTSAFLATQYGISPWLGTIAAILMASMLGMIFGYPALKTKGFYLSLVTIALQMIFTLMIINTAWLGGPNGIPGIPNYSIFGHSLGSSFNLFGFELPYQANYFYLVFLLLAVASVVASRLYNSRIGLAWNAIEQDEIVAETQGVNLTKVKLLSFVLGAGFAGLAGALYGSYTSFIGVENFNFEISLILICMVLLGGMDRVPGVILGAILLTIVDEKLRDLADYRMLMYSVILIVILLSRPQGLLPKLGRKYNKLSKTIGSTNSTVKDGRDLPS